LSVENLERKMTKYLLDNIKLYQLNLAESKIKTQDYMLSKKLNTTLFTTALISLVIISSCKDEKDVVKEDTLNNWATVTVTFSPSQSTQARQSYLDSLKQYISSYVSSKSDTTKSQKFSALFSEATRDSLHTAIMISVNRTYFLKDSISNPRPNPCPPTGPGFDDDGLLSWTCLFE